MCTWAGCCTLNYNSNPVKVIDNLFAGEGEGDSVGGGSIREKERRKKERGESYQLVKLVTAYVKRAYKCTNRKKNKNR